MDLCTYGHCHYTTELFFSLQHCHHDLSLSPNELSCCLVSSASQGGGGGGGVAGGPHGGLLQEGGGGGGPAGLRHQL